MGARDNPPLPEDTLPLGWDTDWLEGWCCHSGKACQEQTEAHHLWAGGQAEPGAEGCQVCGVLSSYTEGAQECFWWSHPGSLRTPWASKTEEVPGAVVGALGIRPRGPKIDPSHAQGCLYSQGALLWEWGSNAGFAFEGVGWVVVQSLCLQNIKDTG